MIDQTLSGGYIGNVFFDNLTLLANGIQLGKRLRQTQERRDCGGDQPAADEFPQWAAVRDQGIESDHCHAEDRRVMDVKHPRHDDAEAHPPQPRRVRLFHIAQGKDHRPHPHRQV